MRTHNLNKLACFLIVLLGIYLQGCRKFLEVDPPPTSVSSETVFNSNQDATLAVIAIYTGMIESSAAFASGEYSSITWLCGLTADELENFYADNHADYYRNSVLEGDGANNSLWASLYKSIYDANALLEGLGRSTNISDSIKVQLAGEAKFIRAFCYFYLTNLYGNVPLTLTTDYQANNTISKSPPADVYLQIIKDLQEAKNELPVNYLDGFNKITNERVRSTKLAASALLSRVYLYTNAYVNAEIESSTIINSTAVVSPGSVDNTFRKNSSQTIWALQPVIPGYNTFDAQSFILTATPTRVALAANLLQAFEPGDTRKDKWTGNITVGTKTYSYPYKYKANAGAPTNPVTEYLIVLRLAEQYLIRAEARINQGSGTKIAEGIADLNALRTGARAMATSLVPNPLPPLLATLSKAEALIAVEHERQMELFTEWGHRWFDLKRTGRANAVLGPIKGNSWTMDDQLFPIPLTEIQRNSKLKPQNPGYN